MHSVASSTEFADSETEGLIMDGRCDIYSSIREVFPLRLTPALVASKNVSGTSTLTGPVPLILFLSDFSPTSSLHSKY